MHMVRSLICNNVFFSHSVVSDSQLLCAIYSDKSSEFLAELERAMQARALLEEQLVRVQQFNELLVSEKQEVRMPSQSIENDLLSVRFCLVTG